MLVGDGADELEADGKARGSEAARNGNCGDASEIGGTVCAQEQGAGGMIGFAEADGFLADERRGDWGCWYG